VLLALSLSDCACITHRLQVVELGRHAAHLLCRHDHDLPRREKFQPLWVDEENSERDRTTREEEERAREEGGEEWK
jgi:hypothetical protein